MDAKADNRDAACAQAADALSAHFDGVADEVSRGIALSHLQSCPACARMWEEWQELKAMEQLALEPLPGNISGTVPLAPVAAPRHLQQSILRHTSRAKTPLLQRLWPRIALGAAVPAAAAICWALLALAPGQQVSNPQDQPPQVIANLPATPEHDQLIPKTSTITATAISSKKVTEVAVSDEEESNNTSPTNPAHLIAAVDSPTRAKSTLRRSSTRRHRGHRKSRRSRAFSASKKPQISLASVDQPRSRAARAITAKAPSSTRVAASSPRATAPGRATNSEPSQTLIASTQDSEEVSDPVLDYIHAHDVRPTDIRQAVENYRSALLTVRLDDSEL